MEKYNEKIELLLKIIVAFFLHFVYKNKFT